uniref:SAYSvFN domain-containing protein 1 n=1 Tax=Cacopsylla melanoneura TaxID=428564 RepID=A0A8D8U332_9HEMI
MESMDPKVLSLDYEKKLNELRARRRRQELMDHAKESLSKVIPFMDLRKESSVDEDSSKKKEESKTDSLNEPLHSQEEDDPFEYVDITSETSFDSLDSVDSDISTCWNWGKVALYTTLWFTLFGLAVYAEFGFVFVILSGFALIWFNTRTGPKRRGEVSAYSVFNPNCAPIDGALDARQFDREIRGGMGF